MKRMKQIIAATAALSVSAMLGCTACRCNRVFMPELTEGLEPALGWQPVGACCPGHIQCVKYKALDGVNTVTRHITRTGFAYETQTLLARGTLMPAALNAEETEDVRRGGGEGLRASVPPRPPR